MIAILSLAGSVLLALLPQRDSVLARRLRWEALDQRAMLNYDSALVLVQASRKADPRYFPAQYDYVLLRHDRYEESALRREAAILARSDDPNERCLGITAAGFADNRDILPDLLALVRSTGETVCSTYSLAAQPRRRDYPDSLKSALFERAIRDTPDWEAAWEVWADVLQRSGNSKEAERIIERGQRSVRHSLARMHLAMREVWLRLDRGDTAGALALRRSVRAAMERDGRPGLRAVYEDNPCHRRGWTDLGDDPAAEQRRALDPPRFRGDWAWHERTLISCGHALLDRGETLEALEPITKAIAIADSVRRPDLYLELYLQRGRVYAKLGRTREAERDLQRALTLGTGAGRLYNVADAYQQLAEMYEAAGAWSAAIRAADRFVAIARPMQGVLRLSSLLDAGEIRWKAGWHASANAAFEEMVRASDELEVEHYWAGEYYERIGDLERARQYYKKACAEYAWNSRAQSGLARVYETLGQIDSAEAIARIHDLQEALWPPLEVPLVPAILARHGRSAEAIRIARAWAERQETRGNVQGAMVAYLRLSRLALDARSADAALAAATRAGQLAATLHLSNDKTRAAMLRGLALDALGSRDSALATLRDAVALARSDSTADNLLETSLALGDALAGRGQVDAALIAYDRAAQSAERVTGSLVEDLDRARYRDRHLLPFDGAIKALVRGAVDRARVEQLVAWSARRKAAALALAARDAPKTAAVGRPTLSDLQRRLGAADALLDYIVLDSVVGVVVITRDRASFIRLSISADSLASAIERLRHPLTTVYGGRLDLARAHFDFSNAAGLHETLIRPAAALLAGKRRVMIVPDGPLHALPFEALVSGGTRNYADVRYLIDAYEVEYLPSSSFLRADSERTESVAGSTLLVVAFGAPGGDREAAALNAAWPAGRTTTLAGPAATERATTGAMRRAGIIHFAVHAEASARDPLASHLRLAPDSTEDGYLHLGEIAASKVGARLVVLSACETDVGRIYNGEGVMGLARAFLASGAHAVVGTQWPIGPETAALMREFYRRLASGEDPPAALRAAKRAMRSDPATAHPFYWAGAVLVEGRARR